MKQDWILTRETFDQLLTWLDADRERAGEKYELIRHTLIKIFTCRRSPCSEDLADETINRVARRIPDLDGAYVGDPALYFYGVANRVHLDFMRKRPRARSLAELAPAGDRREREDDCLQRCLQCLKEPDRELIQQYYLEDKQAKIDRRKALARSLGIPVNALRIRAHRIRANLHDCVLRCLEGKDRP